MDLVLFELDYTFFQCSIDGVGDKLYIFDSGNVYNTTGTYGTLSDIKLKENIMESTPFKEEKGLSKIAVAKDIVKFSDELKKKAKKLKPIEFN